MYTMLRWELGPLRLWIYAKQRSRLDQFPSRKSSFPPWRCQSSGFLVRRTQVRLRATPRFPTQYEKYLLSESETASVLYDEILIRSGLDLFPSGFSDLKKVLFRPGRWDRCQIGHSNLWRRHTQVLDSPPTHPARRYSSTPPRNPSISLPVRKIPLFRTETSGDGGRGLETSGVTRTESGGRNQVTKEPSLRSDSRLHNGPTFDAGPSLRSGPG